jgi:hypothetical protein
MTTRGGIDVQFPVSLTLPAPGSEWSASRPCGFTPGNNPLYLLEGGWLGPITGMENNQKGNILYLPGLELRPPAIQSLASRITDTLSRLLVKDKWELLIQEC